jgi:hypothetical protein
MFHSDFFSLSFLFGLSASCEEMLMTFFNERRAEKDRYHCLYGGAAGFSFSQNDHRWHMKASTGSNSDRSEEETFSVFGVE